MTQKLKTTTSTRVVLRGARTLEGGGIEAEGTTFDCFRYSQFPVREAMAERGEIRQDEVYGIEEARDHAREIQDGAGMDEWAKREHGDYWKRKAFIVQVVTTVTVDAVTIPGNNDWDADAPAPDDLDVELTEAIENDE